MFKDYNMNQLVLPLDFKVKLQKGNNPTLLAIGQLFHSLLLIIIDID